MIVTKTWNFFIILFVIEILDRLLTTQLL